MNFSVEGYEDCELIWEKLCNLNDNIQSMTFEQSIINSEFMISINERKILKIKKNDFKNGKKKFLHKGKIQTKKCANFHRKIPFQGEKDDTIQ